MEADTTKAKLLHFPVLDVKECKIYLDNYKERM
jgi:hypothetical protein